MVVGDNQPFIAALVTIDQEALKGWVANNKKEGASINDLVNDPDLIAASFRKPIVSVWGNTVPSFGMSHYMPGEEEKSIIIENNSLKCRPCSKIGFDKCPKGHFECIRGIDDQLIADALLRYWKSA